MDAMRPQYEFKESENRIVGKAGTWAMILAIVMFTQATFDLIGSQNFISAGIGVTIGIFYLLASRSLKGVVNTEGDDVSLMMRALNKLGVAFLIRAIVTGIAAAVLLTIAIIAVVAVAAS